jgi:3-methyladenine DNA glycosylase AlkD
MNSYVSEVETAFKNHANPENAEGQKAYMRNQFDFLGIKSPIRKEIQQSFLRKKNLPPKEELENIVKSLWDKPQREFQYFALELADKYTRQVEAEDIILFEWMVTHKSWWDTVDFVAPRLMGNYFKLFPDLRDKKVEAWLNSENRWLMRSALLFQLKYNAKLDTLFLEHVINSLLGSKEFFINKAIGWILRQYSKSHPQWVIDFVNRTNLDPLSRREALKVIERKGG